MMVNVNGRKRQAKGTPVGGQFAEEPRKEPQVVLAHPPVSVDLQHGLDAVKDMSFFTSYYFGHDDGLENNPELLNRILAGDEDTQEEVEEIWGEPRRAAVDEQVKTIIDENELELTADEEEELRFAVEERDDANYWDEPLRHTSNVLLRHRLDNTTHLHQQISPEAAYGQTCFDNENLISERHQAIKNVLQNAGFDTEHETVNTLIDDLIHNGPHNWHEAVKLEIVWYDQPAPLELVTKDKATLKFSGAPYVLLIDSMNGSGYDTQIPVKPDGLTRTFDKQNPAVVDDAAPGYGWDNIAGLYKPAYKVDTQTITTTQPLPATG